MTTDTLREAVARAQCAAGGLDPDEIMPNGGPRWRYYLPTTDAALSAIEAAGWRIVPVEATEAMLDAGLRDDTAHPGYSLRYFLMPTYTMTHRDLMAQAHAAMLAAAPRLDATVRSGEEG